MLYTGRGNKLIWYVLIPAIFILYFIFLFWSENFGNKVERDRYSSFHKENITKLENIDGLILGGSNAAGGISAHILKEAFDESWYNLSLTAEGYSDENYWEFVKNSISKESRKMVTTVIYSSSSILQANLINTRNSFFYKFLYSPKTILIPSKSIASYLKTFLNGYEDITSMDYLGDRIFNNESCKLTPLISLNNRETDTNQINKWVFSQLDTLSSIFPNAKVFFVIPSEYYSNIDKKRSDKNLQAIKEALEKYSQSRGADIILIPQPPYPSIDFLCNDGMHANFQGRIWRTNNLLQLQEIAQEEK